MKSENQSLYLICINGRVGPICIMFDQDKAKLYAKEVFDKSKDEVYILEYKDSNIDGPKKYVSRVKHRMKHGVIGWKGITIERSHGMISKENI